MKDDGEATIISILIGSADKNPHLRNLGMQRFVHQYSKPLERFLVHSKKQPVDRANDIVQSFWLKKLIEPVPERNLVSKYLQLRESSRSDGRLTFRGYLYRSMNRYMIDYLRATKPFVSSDEFDLPERAEQEEQQFDREWANETLQAVCQSVRDECRIQGQNTMWELFVRQILVPNLTQSAPPGYAELSKDFKFETPRKAANAVRTVIRKFQTHMERRIADYLPVNEKVAADREIQLEFDDLVMQLSKPGALDYAVFEEWLKECDSTALTPIQSKEQFSVIDLENNKQFRRTFVSALYPTSEDLAYRWKQLASIRVNDWLNSYQLDKKTSSQCTYGELVSGSSLSIIDIQLVRDSAKALAISGADESVEILSLMYQIAIALGVLQHGQLLTSDSISKIQGRSLKFEQTSWIDSCTRTLLHQFNEHIASK